MSNIPIYRAKKIDGDEYLEFTSYYKYNDIFYAIVKIVEMNQEGWLGVIHLPLTQKIDPSTLSIHFPEWVCISQETEEHVKVFASLDSVNRIGGSELEVRSNEFGMFGVLNFDGFNLMVDDVKIDKTELQAFEETGIKQ